MMAAVVGVGSSSEADDGKTETSMEGQEYMAVD